MDGMGLRWVIPVCWAVPGSNWNCRVQKGPGSRGQMASLFYLQRFSLFLFLFFGSVFGSGSGSLFLMFLIYSVAIG
jgi:hypothetical protein